MVLLMKQLLLKKTTYGKRAKLELYWRPMWFLLEREIDRNVYFMYHDYVINDQKQRVIGEIRKIHKSIAYYRQQINKLCENNTVNSVHDLQQLLGVKFLKNIPLHKRCLIYKVYIDNLIETLAFYFIHNEHDKLLLDFNRLILYSNDVPALTALGKQLDALRNVVIENHVNPLPQCDVNLYVLPDNVDVGEIVLTKRMAGLSHKVTLNSKCNRETAPSFYKWLLTNKKQLYYSDKFIERVAGLLGPVKGGYYHSSYGCSGRYFFTRNEKVLCLLQLSYGNLISKIEKITIRDTV